MRTILSVGALLLLVVVIVSGQVANVSPQNLAGTSEMGVDANALARGTVLTIPAGAQFVRSVPGKDVTISLVTKPVFGAETQDWPVLELGPNTLVFLRNGAAGQLSLVLGDTAPTALPFTIPLDADGHSTNPITLSLVQSGGNVTINAFGQTLRFPTVSPTTASAEVVLSAGGSDAWALDSLKVSVTAPVSDANGHSPSSTGSTSSGDTPVSHTVPASSVGADTVTPPGNSITLASGKVIAMPAASQLESRTLEIFTPPSVRLSRADTARLALTQGKKP
jgi:hypothetical protein